MHCDSSDRTNATTLPEMRKCIELSDTYPFSFPSILRGVEMLFASGKWALMSASFTLNARFFINSVRFLDSVTEEKNKISGKKRC